MTVETLLPMINSILHFVGWVLIVVYGLCLLRNITIGIVLVVSGLWIGRMPNFPKWLGNGVTTSLTGFGLAMAGLYYLLGSPWLALKDLMELRRRPFG